MEPKTWTTNEELIKRARELSEKATPGPWTLDRKPRDPDGWPTDTIVASTAPGNGIYASPPGGTYPANDRVFIAESRTLVPALADALEAAIQQNWIRTPVPSELGPLADYWVHKASGYVGLATWTLVDGGTFLQYRTSKEQIRFGLDQVVQVLPFEKPKPPEVA